MNHKKPLFYRDEGDKGDENLIKLKTFWLTQKDSAFDSAVIRLDPFYPC
jgi:hypothetical protein